MKTLANLQKRFKALLVNKQFGVSPKTQRAQTLQQAREAIADWDVPRAAKLAESLSDCLDKHLLLCEIFYLQGDMAPAAQHIENAWKLAPYSEKAFTLARSILGPDRAAETLGRLCAQPLSTLDDDKVHGLVEILFHADRLREAIDVVEQARRLGMGSPALLKKLEARELRCLQLLGENEEVVERTRISAANRTLAYKAAVARARALFELGRVGEVNEFYRSSLSAAARSAFDTVEFHQVLRTEGPSAAYALYAKSAPARALASAFPSNYVNDLSLFAAKSPPGLFVTAYGAGDEIRHASIYPALAANCAGAAITCDPRLETLFTRSFQGLRFRPVTRWRQETRFGKHAERSGVRGNITCAQMLDAATFELAAQMPALGFVEEMIHRVFPDSERFYAPRPPYLKPDPALVAQFRQRTDAFRASGKKLVGVSWRSNLRGPARNIHYTAVAEWTHILRDCNAVFINLQPAISDEERHEIDRLGGKLFEVPGVDLFDDFEGLAALMLNLDVVVAPATTTIELAGAIGARSLFLAPGFETAWRRQPGGKDAWHASVEVIVPSRLGDKADMLRQLYDYLEKL